jgi:hypothetical protein
MATTTTTLHHLLKGSKYRALYECPAARRGFDWNILGSGAELYTNICTYSAQFESIASRWEESDFGLLQPVVPGPGLGLMLAHGAVQMQQAAKSEQELLFRSGAARTASGAVMAAFTSAGVDAMEEQT